jgi:hypothetical protein
MPGGPVHRRRLDLRPGRLEVTDTLAGPFRRAVSRVRLDAGAAARVRLTGSSPVVRAHPDRWHLRHGEPLPAVVHEQEIPMGGLHRWILEW